MKIHNIAADATHQLFIYAATSTAELLGLPISDTVKLKLQAIISDDKEKMVRFDVDHGEGVLLYNAKGAPTAVQLEYWRRLGAKAAKLGNEAKTTAVQIHTPPAIGLAIAEGLALANYQFLKYFTDAEKRANAIQQICVCQASEAAVAELQVIVDSVYEARHLINEPVITLTAVQLAKEAERLGKAAGFKVEVLTKTKIESLKMGGLLAVNYGSIDPPTFTIMEYKHPDCQWEQPLVLVGKGIVYDTGGLSLKPTAGSMDSMKSDMSGAAAAIGTMTAVAKAKLPVHVVALVPATDNRPGMNAYTPGDVIEMGSGKKVEVLNTDAEGRMILADALHFAKKYKPSLVIDLATLTGAAAIAIGKYGIVAMGNAAEEEFAALSKSGHTVHERIAQFPFWEEYDELIQSTIADIKNIGGREGGAITAGKFLANFIDYPWIHLDIAGPAFLDSDDHYRLKGGTGVGVRLLFDFLKNKA
ncbi:MAG: leucyl aminopeptidase [Schleiferiaceae bacterium]|nr:leucyl aminopeptidase [Schleiferiaceae bacterium]